MAYPSEYSIRKSARRPAPLNQDIASPIFTSQQADDIVIGNNIFAVSRPILTLVNNATVDTLLDVLKQSPELQAVMRAIIHDLVADEYKFDGSSSAISRTENFDEKTEFYRKLVNALWDWLLYGDAFMLKLRLGNSDIERFMLAYENVTGFNFNPELKKRASMALQLISTTQPPNQIQNLDSRVIEPLLNSNNGNVEKWIIRNNTGMPTIINTHDMVHLTTDNLGGRTFGFTPAHVLLKDILTLIFAKDYAAKVYENNSLPRGIFNFPNSDPDNPRDVEKFEEQLRRIKMKENKLGVILTTGEFNYTDLKTMAEQLEFRDLMEHFTMLIMMAWGVPAHRIAFMSKNSGKVDAKIANEGYFKSLSCMQRVLECQFNNQLFNEFNTKMRFNKNYRIDELREANIAAILADRGLATTKELRMKFLDLPGDMPNDPLPTLAQQQIDTRFMENRDKKRENGDMRNIEEKPDTAEAKDNKNKLYEFYDEAICKGEFIGTFEQYIHQEILGGRK